MPFFKLEITLLGDHDQLAAIMEENMFLKCNIRVITNLAILIVNASTRIY